MSLSAGRSGPSRDGHASPFCGATLPMMQVIKRSGILLLTIYCLHLSLQASPKKARAATYGPNKLPTANSLEQLSSSLEDVAKRVEPSVVRILSSAYAIENDADHSGGAAVAQQRSSGSGILVSSDGYIVTNAHVVQGARRLRVRLNKRVSKAGSHLVDAKLIGMDRQTDLAVIKIDLTRLPFLKFADSSNLNQGQIVLAFGSPLGLENSVSMGVVSAVDRQLNADSPLAYIQTDAAINPGNSGGPLVDTAGEVVGVNAFILTKSGGNEGVGFAIPSNLVSSICRQIRTEHHVHHHQVGIFVRAITPALARALNLPTEDGVLIEDVNPQSPADAAGLNVGDIIVAVHAKPIPNVRQFALNMYSYAVGDKAEIDVLRGEKKLSFAVPVVERGDDPQRFEDLVTEEENSIAKLGILGLTVDEKVSAMLPPLRANGGVLVAAKMATGGAYFGDEFAAGDVIHAVNGKEIKDVASLKVSLESLSSDSALVIQVERSGVLQFVVLESD
jgi:serine protease Do